VIPILRGAATPPADAADVFQQALLVVWRKHDAAPSDAGEALAWMIGIARLELANHRRGNRRRLAATDRLRAELSAQLAPTGSPAPTDDHAERLRAAIAVLPEADREIARLTYWDALTSKQVGAVLGLSPAAVRKRLQRARATLSTHPLLQSSEVEADGFRA